VPVAFVVIVVMTVAIVMVVTIMVVIGTIAIVAIMMTATPVVTVMPATIAVMPAVAPMAITIAPTLPRMEMMIAVIEAAIILLIGGGVITVVESVAIAVGIGVLAGAAAAVAAAITIMTIAAIVATRQIETRLGPAIVEAVVAGIDFAAAAVIAGKCRAGEQNHTQTNPYGGQSGKKRHGIPPIDFASACKSPAATW
jgi:hypothetical protein